MSEQRVRDAERTRQRIRQAAVAEFGAKGYAGARTAGIAARAGVNPQLISYYFGGKQGLMEELRGRWAQTEATLAPPGASFLRSVSAYLDATLDQPDWARLMIWQALGDQPDGHDQPERAAAQRAKLTSAVERIRQRQHDGELAADLDPAMILLLAYALVFAPIAMPQIVEAILGVDPGWAGYRRRCLSTLSTLVDPGRAER